MAGGDKNAQKMSLPEELWKKKRDYESSKRLKKRGVRESSKSKHESGGNKKRKNAVAKKSERDNAWSTFDSKS